MKLHPAGAGAGVGCVSGSAAAGIIRQRKHLYLRGPVALSRPDDRRRPSPVDPVVDRPRHQARHLPHHHRSPVDARLGLAFGYSLRATAWGRHVYAAGDDAEAAELAGIRVKRVLLSVYVVAGLVFAVAAWILMGRVGSASPNTAVDANLDSITAVVIGGTSLFGGRGVIAGSLLGALIVGVFRNGLALVGVDVLYQTFAVGVVVIVAVGIDQWIRKVRK